jgi:hypothetical protein
LLGGPGIGSEEWRACRAWSVRRVGRYGNLGRREGGRGGLGRRGRVGAFACARSGERTPLTGMAAFGRLDDRVASLRSATLAAQ